MSKSIAQVVAVMLKVGFGFAVILKVLVVPTQPFKVGVIVTVETCCVATFDAVKAAILPVPVADKPVLVLLFAQENVEPDGVLTKFVAKTVVPAQTVWSTGVFTEGFGLTVIIKVCGAPAVEQPFKVGVTVTVEICCVATFDAVNAPILPVPLAVKPVLVLLFVHAKVAPEGVLLKTEATTFAPAQTV